MQKRWKKRQNTVFGYKKGSKLNSEIGIGSTTQKLCLNIYVTFSSKWLEHTCRGGGKTLIILPPLQLEICQFEGVCLGGDRKLEKRDRRFRGTNEYLFPKNLFHKNDEIFFKVSYRANASLGFFFQNASEPAILSYIFLKSTLCYNSPKYNGIYQSEKNVATQTTSFVTFLSCSFTILHRNAFFLNYPWSLRSTKQKMS